MKTEQQKQAESLYFQTDLTKTEIAKIIGVSRRTLHYWVQQNHWDAIKQNASIMPMALAGNCYLIMANFQQSLLSPERAGRPATQQEVNTMYRLTMTINKLNSRATLNESLEMMTRFMEFAGALDPRLIDILRPVVDGYIKHRAGDASMFIAAAHATTSVAKPNETEEQLDVEDLVSWASAMGNDCTAAAELPVEPVTASHIATPTANAAPFHTPALPKQNTDSSRQGHIVKGKANNRAARRAQAQSAARQARAAA